VANITFIIKTSPNTNPKEKKVGGHGILYPPPEKVGGHVPCIPHQIAPMRPIMTLVQITNYTSPNYTDRLQVNIHCIENFFTVRFLSNLRLPWKNRVALKFFTVLNIRFTLRILTTCACPENRVSPEIFHCIEYIFYHSGFLSNFVLALKNRVALEFFTVLNLLFTFRSFEQLACACPEKQSCFEFTVLIIYFLSFRIFEQLALGLKNRVALIFSLY